MAVQNYGNGGGFQLSPGVNFSEIDLTTNAPPVATTIGAIAGVFRWGPVGQRVLVSSENDLIAKFGKPSSVNPETFFVAADFLGYSNALIVSRAGSDSVQFSAIANSSAFSANAAHTINNSVDYETKKTSFDAAVNFVARYPGALGNSLKISVCDTANQYSSSLNLRSLLSNTSFDTANTKITVSVGSNTATVTLANTSALAASTPLPFAANVAALFNVGDYIVVGNTSIGKQELKINSVGTVAVVNSAGTNTGTATFTLSLAQPLKLSTNIDSNTVVRQWEFFNVVDTAPGQSEHVANFGNTSAQDEMHIVVVDQDGGFAGSPGAVLEVFSGVSRATDAKGADGGSIYYKTVLENKSAYVWPASARSGAATANAASVASSTATVPNNISFAGGVDGDESSTAFADIARAYDLFAASDDVDISLVLTGKSRGGTNGEQLANYIIDNICEVRKDCMAFVSPAYDDVVNQTLGAVDNVVTFRNSMRSTSYAVMDSGYKYQYDKYNDTFRFIPLNGAVAGTCVYTDGVRDPWVSPAGTSRGQIKNVIKLAFNPKKAERDTLYKNGINPVITEAGQGTYLFGDKTLLNKPSAFDRINVRRLFIILEKSISVASKSFLFEFNDEFTRAQFVNLVDPFLRDIQGRRGITDYRVVCDTTNNTAEVVDSNRFVGDIWIKPNRSINFIQLNFVAVRSGVEFNEIVG